MKRLTLQTARWLLPGAAVIAAAGLYVREAAADTFLATWTYFSNNNCTLDAGGNSFITFAFSSGTQNGAPVTCSSFAYGNTSYARCGNDGTTMNSIFGDIGYLNSNYDYISEGGGLNAPWGKLAETPGQAAYGSSGTNCSGATVSGLAWGYGR